ncbi:MAG TPA: hypothetical protein VGE52_21115 [Pirellulales bacterium]
MSLLQWLSAKTLRERTKGYHALAAPGRLAEIVAELLAGPERRRLIEALPTAWRPEDECFSDDVSGNGRLRCNFRAMSSLTVAAAESLEAFSVATSPASLSPFPNAVVERIVSYTVDAIVAFAAANGPSPPLASIPPDAAASAGLGAVLSSFVDGLDLLAPPRDDRHDAATFVDTPLVARVLLALRREFRWSPTSCSASPVEEALSPTARANVAVGVAMSLDLLAAFLPPDGRGISEATVRGIAASPLASRPIEAARTRRSTCIST